jgi:hypothetical protein
MYTLLRRTPVRSLAIVQAPAFLSSLLIAELFFKFGSFGLECIAFLATWFAVDLVLTKVQGGGDIRRAGQTPTL